MSTILDLDAPEVRRLIRVFSIGDTDMAGAELPDDFTDLVLRALLFSALANRAACLQFVNEHERDQLWFYAYVRIPKEHAQAECGGRKVPVYETPDGLRWVRFDFVPLPSNAAEDIFACLREYSGTSPFGAEGSLELLFEGGRRTAQVATATDSDMRVYFDEERPDVDGMKAMD